MSDSRPDQPTLPDGSGAGSVPSVRHEITLPEPLAPRDTPTIALESTGIENAVLTIGPGTRIGDYELIEEIARGGMGIIFKARQISLNRIVAVKMILSGRLASETDRLRFRAEAEAAANLDHPNILPIYEVGEFQGHSYFSMKLIDGGNLAEAISRFMNDHRAASRIMIQIARAVHFAHLHGTLHRDLKPANVLLGRDSGSGNSSLVAQPPPDRVPSSTDSSSTIPETPIITDFGLAKRTETDSGLTRTGVVMGTPSYMAPEQAKAEKVLTTGVDIYSLGAIFYEMLTGKVPFEGESVIETLRKVAEQEPVSPRKINPTVDRDLAVITLKCLEKDPTRRYESAAALADDLERWLQNEPIRARPATIIERTVKWAKRHPGMATLSVLMIVLLIASYAIVSYQLWVTSLAKEDADQKSKRLEEKTEELAKQAEELKASRIRVRRELHQSNLLRGDLLFEQRNGDEAERIWWRSHLARLDSDDQRAWWRLEELYRQYPRKWGILFDKPNQRPVMELSPDQSKLLIGEGNTLKVYDAANGQLQETIPLTHGEISSIAFDPEGKRCAISHRPDGTITLRLLASLSEVEAVKTHPVEKKIIFKGPKLDFLEKELRQISPLLSSSKASLLFLDSNRLLVLETFQIWLLDLQTNHWLSAPHFGGRLNEEEGPTRVLGKLGSNQWLFQIRDQIEKWEFVNDKAGPQRYLLMNSGVESVKWNPIYERRGMTITSSGGKEVLSVQSAALTLDGQSLVIQENNNRIRQWNISAGMKLVSQDKVSENLTTMLLCANEPNQLLRVTSAGMEIRSLPKFKIERSFARLGSQVQGVRWNAKDQRVYLIEKNRIGMYDFSAHAMTPIRSDPSSRRTEIAREGPLFTISANALESAELWENDQPRELPIPEKKKTRLLSQIETLSANGELLASGTPSFFGGSCSVRLFDLKQNKPLGEVALRMEKGSSSRILHQLSFSGDNRQLIASTDQGLFIVDVNGKKVIGHVSLPNQNFFTSLNSILAYYSPESQKIAIQVLSSTWRMEDAVQSPTWGLWLIDTRTGKLLRKSDRVYQGSLLGWTPDGKELVIRVDDHLVRWDAETLTPLTGRDIPGLTNRIDAFSPNGKWCLLLNRSKIRVWDLEKNDELASIDLGLGEIRTAIFSSDNKRIRYVTDKQSGELHLGALAEFVNGNLGSELELLLRDLHRLGQQMEIDRILDRLQTTDIELYRRGQEVLQQLGPLLNRTEASIP